MAEKKGVRFREVQRLADRSSWVAMRILLAIVLVGVVVVAVVDRDWWLLCLWLGVAAPCTWVSLVGLTTEVRGDGLYVRFRPCQRRLQKVPLEDVTGCEAKEWGRWWASWMRGFPFGGGKRPKYIAKGRQGVRIDYADGSYVLIGSESPEELAAAIRKLLEEKGER